MLDKLIEIRKKLLGVAVDGNELRGTIFATAEVIDILKQFELEDCIDPFVEVSNRNMRFDEVPTGSPMSIRVYPGNVKGGKFYETSEAFLKANSERYPDFDFYVHDIHFLSSRDEKPDRIENYASITKLIGFLIEKCDYTYKRTTTTEVIFFTTKKLVMQLGYSTDQLNNKIKIQDLIDYIENSSDKEERKIIFVNELTSLLNKETEEIRFRYLIANFSIFWQSYRNSITLYLEKYSYQKFKSELNKDALEYTKKIQSVINDAQGKLVAVPAAFIFILGQFDLAGEKMFSNTSLIMGALVFSMLLEVLLRNQYASLDFISDDMMHFQQHIEERKSNILGADVDNIFKTLTKMHRKQLNYLNIIRVLIWSVPAISIIVFAYTIHKFYTK
jgi:hypothetical protein